MFYLLYYSPVDWTPNILHAGFGQRSLLASDIPENIMEEEILPKKMKIL